MTVFNRQTAAHLLDHPLYVTLRYVRFGNVLNPENIFHSVSSRLIRERSAPFPAVLMWYFSFRVRTSDNTQLMSPVWHTDTYSGGYRGWSVVLGPRVEEQGGSVGTGHYEKYTTRKYNRTRWSAGY